jgi:hypothetical protein
MRDRLTELLPLLLVGLVLLVFQLSRTDPPMLRFQPFGEPTPTAVPRQSISGTTVPALQAADLTQLAVCSMAYPRFMGGIAVLKAKLGRTMGDPLECERVVNNDGDTQQKTTTGLAYYRKLLNTACFTNGWEHWGLVDKGFVHWAGPTVDPPADAAIVTTR